MLNRELPLHDITVGLWCAVSATSVIKRIHGKRPLVLYCGRVPAANAPGCTAAEGLLYEPWSIVFPTCTARGLHQRP